jgi:hypothetical protein
MDDAQLDALLQRVQQEPVPGRPIDPEAVWLGVSERRSRTTRRRRAAWFAAAALIGLGLGRRSVPIAPSAAVLVDTMWVDRPSLEQLQLDALAASSATLLTAVVRGEPMTPDSTWRSGITTMLWATRQLLDAPTLDVSRVAILQDLELVLVQLLGISPGSDSLELELARDAIQWRALVARIAALPSGEAPPARRGGGGT